MLKKIYVSLRPDTEKVEVEYQGGTLKETTNYNKVLDTLELTTKTYKGLNPMPFLKEGSFIWVENELKYIVDTIKKTTINHRFVNYQVSAVSVTILLQKVILPNKSITQRIYTGSIPKKVFSEINKLIQYFNQCSDIGIQSVYPDNSEISEEFIWTQPTLFECLCDLGAKTNRVPQLTFVNDSSQKFWELTFIDTTAQNGYFTNTSLITTIETHESLETSPNRMINLIENNISKGTIIEKHIYPKSEIGIVDDADEGVFVPTTYPINKLIKVYAEAVLPSTWKYEVKDGIGATYCYGGRNAGYYKIDITDMVLEKSVYNSLKVSKKFFGSFISPLDFNTRNFHIYYEKDKPNIYDIKQSYKRLIVGNIMAFNINQLLSYVGVKTPEKVIVGQGYPEPTPIVLDTGYWFNKDDAQKFIFTIEYQTMDNVRFDLVKESGTGAIVQNQNNAFINFVPYYRQQKNLMNRLGNPENVFMGRKHDTDTRQLAKLGQIHQNQLIVQTTEVYYPNHIDFMFMTTSTYNRVDSESAINTKKRFTSIVPATESIERHEYLETQVNAYSFYLIKEKVVGGYYYVISLEASSISQTVYLNYLVQEIDENTLLVTAKTLDNLFAGLKIRDDGSTRYVEGVPYVNNVTGEANFVTLYFNKINAPNSNISKLKEFPDGNAISSDKIKEIGQIWYKDNRERLAFSILVKKSV